TTIDDLIQSSLLKWIPYSEITVLKSSPIDSIHYAALKETFGNGRAYEMMTMLLCLGNSEECIVSEFARIYSLPTHKYNNDVSQFRRYSKWLESRNKLIKGFIKSNNKYYIVGDKLSYHYYFRYGFCSACGILRCSPVWCVCGYKEL